LLSSIVIILVSSLLFLYWFRCTSLLILGQRSRAEYALRVASTIRLSFPEIHSALQTELETPALDRLNRALESDYRILTELLRQEGAASIERRILTIDYKVMRIWYRLTRSSHGLPWARNALLEMSSILSYFAGEIGQSAAF
jgi:hypothetical protein